MALFADVSVLALLWKGLAFVGLTLAGVGLLRSAHVDQSPRLTAAREARKPAYVSPHAQPLPRRVEAPRLATGADLSRLAVVLDHARDRVHAIQAATMSAGRQIDGAEVAFNRLIQEIGGVMPAVIAATVVPRRSLAPVVDTTLAPTTVRAA